MFNFIIEKTLLWFLKEFSVCIEFRVSLFFFFFFSPFPIFSLAGGIQIIGPSWRHLGKVLKGQFLALACFLHCSPCLPPQNFSFFSCCFSTSSFSSILLFLFGIILRFIFFLDFSLYQMLSFPWNQSLSLFPCCLFSSHDATHRVAAQEDRSGPDLFSEQQADIYNSY